MKKIGIVFVKILPGILVLAVVFAGIVSGFRFIPGIGRGKKEDLKNVDPDLITYSEVMQIKPEMEELHGLATGGDVFPLEKTGCFILVCPTMLKCMKKQAGNRMILIGYIGKENNTPGVQEFVVRSPYFDVALGMDKTLWVVNPGRHLLQNYTPEGKFIRCWGHSSVSIDGFCGCCNPTHIAITDEGSFVTSEKGIARVKVYGPEGGFIGVVAESRHFTEETVGLDIAVDSRERIIVLDPERNAVRIFSKKTL